jgi:tripartite-type tricarboxylate transporter receptor subunit TctC
MNRRAVMHGGAAFLSAALPIAFATPARAQTGTFPNRPVRMVIPWPPGQGTDLLGRLVAQALATALGQPVVPDNRSGAGGMTGTQHVARSTPDGYTLLAVSCPRLSWTPLCPRSPPW